MADVTQTQDLSQERLLTGVRRQTVGSTTYPVLGETVLVAKIGEGAAGAVYEGRIPGDERPVAVRVLRCQNEQSERYSQFLAHSRASQNVKSHHLVDIKETGAEPGLFYQVMEYTPSISAHAYLSALRDKLKPGLNELEALELAQAVATGLAALHTANVSHLNISPSTILIPKDSGGVVDFTRCKLGDQGLAYHEHFAKVLEGTAADNGTPGYLSPEQAQGSKNPGKTCDVFAFGASLYAMLAGHAPFDGPSVPVILSVTCLQEVSDLRTWRPDVSRITARLVELCLRKGPSMRFPDASVLQRAVRLCREAQGLPANIQEAAIEEMQALIRQDEVKEQLLSRFFPPPPPDSGGNTEEKLPPATPASTHAIPSPIPAEVPAASVAPVKPLSVFAPAAELPKPAAPVEPPPAPAAEIPPAVPATESAYSTAIEVPPPPEWTEPKSVPPPSHSSSIMPTVGKRPETKLFDDLLRPAVPSVENATPETSPSPTPVPDASPATPLPGEIKDTGELIVLPPEPQVADAPTPANGTPAVVDATAATASPEPPDETNVPYSARVIESPPREPVKTPEPTKMPAMEEGMEATMIGIPKLIDPAAASSAARMSDVDAMKPVLPKDPLAENADGEAIPDATAATVMEGPPVPPVPPPATEWTDPTQNEAQAESLPQQKASWAPLVAALLMVTATMGVLWQKGYLDQWFGAKRVAVAPPPIDPVETGTPPPPPTSTTPNETAKADPLTKEPGEDPAKGKAKAPEDLTKQTEDELKKAAEIRIRAETEARKLAEEIRKTEEAEAKKKQEEFEKQMKALAEEKERKRKEDEAKLVAERAEQEAKAEEERKKRAAQAAQDMPKEVLLDLGEKVTMPFVLVPGGAFKMGTTAEAAQELAKLVGIDPKEYLMEAPPRTVKVEPFYISKTPVSVAQFRRFAEATGYKTAAERVGEAFVLQDKQWKRVKGASWRNPGFKQGDDHPAVLLSYRDCEALVAWASRLSPQPMRLPTEAEWEYAARGADSKTYPWGNGWDARRANFGDKQLSAMVGDANGTAPDDGNAFTSPSGAYDNASWCGAVDMAGNVLQWCSDVFEEYPKSNAPQLQVEAEDIPPDAKRVLRGGSFLVGPSDLRSAARRSSNPRAASVEFGVRLSFTPKH